LPVEMPGEGRTRTASLSPLPPRRLLLAPVVKWGKRKGRKREREAGFLPVMQKGPSTPRKKNVLLNAPLFGPWKGGYKKKSALYPIKANQKKKEEPSSLEL